MILLFLISLFSFPLFSPPALGTHTEGGRALTGKEQAIVKIMENYSVSLNAPQIMYRWQSKSIGASLIKDGIDDKVVFSRKGEVGGNQVMGAAFYMSGNVYDSSGYAPKGDASLVQVTIPQGKKFLDLRDPKIIILLQSHGITTEDVCRFDPGVIIKYDGGDGLDWYAAKDMSGLKVEEFDGNGFTDQQLINFKSAMLSKTARQAYSEMVKGILGKRKLSRRPKDQGTDEKCSLPEKGKQLDFLEVKQLEQTLFQLSPEGVGWNGYGECVRTGEGGETVITPDHRDYPHCLKGNVKYIPYKGKCLFFTPQNIFVDFVEESVCLAPENKSRLLKTPHPQMDLDLKFYSPFKDMLPQLKPDPRMMVSLDGSKLLLQDPPHSDDSQEMKKLLKYHLRQNPRTLQWEVLVRTSSSFRKKSFPSREEALKELQKVPFPVDLGGLLEFRGRVLEDLKKDLSEITTVSDKQDSLYGRVRGNPPLMVTEDDFQKSLFEKLEMETAIPYRSFDQLASQQLIQTVILVEEKKDLDLVSARIQNQFKGLGEKGFFSVQMEMARDENGHEFRFVTGQVRGTGYQILIKTRDSLYEKEFGKTLKTLMEQHHRQGASLKNNFKRDDLARSVKSHLEIKTKMEKDPSFEEFLNRKILKDLEDMTAVATREVIDKNVKKLLKQNRSTKEMEKIIMDTLDKSMPKGTPMDPSLKKISNSLILSAIRNHQHKIIEQKITEYNKAGLAPTLQAQRLKAMGWVSLEDFELRNLMDEAVADSERIFQLKKNLGKKIQEVIDDFYKNPLPKREDIQVMDLTGRKVKWLELARETKKAILKKIGRFSSTDDSVVFADHPFPKHEHDYPRWLHGPTHISRVAIEIEMLAKLYNQTDKTLGITPEVVALAQYLSSFHDSARQSEGIDLWDEESAENARAYLKKLNFSDNKINQLIKAIADKDMDPLDPDYKKRTIISKLIHDADSLDRIRVGGRRNYQIEYLDLFKEYGARNKSLAKTLNSLADDVSSFIELTEAESLKLKLDKDKQQFSTISAMARARTSPLRKWF